MTFSREWEQRYLENTHLSIWPWSDLVSLVRRHCPDLGSQSRVLELGCGAGANIPFFQSLGVLYHAVEGSASMALRLKNRFPQFAATIAVGDFTVRQPFDPGFDLVVDRAALTHNTTVAIESGLRLAWEALRPGGCFIGVDWFSTHYGEFTRGRPAADPNTREGYEIGPFAGTGRVHFSDEGHLRQLFARYELLVLEEKVVRAVVPHANGPFASWNLVARKADV